MHNFSNLPWGYVVRAVSKGVENYHSSLHDSERPIALLSSIYVNSKRDAKRSKAAVWSDFCFYKPRSDGNSASSENGSAMLLMAKKGLLPSWALFCFKEVTTHADPDYKPDVLALVSDDAVLIHPVRDELGYKGLLVARESAGETVRAMTNPETGEVFNLRVPIVQTKVIAEEGAILYFS